MGAVPVPVQLIPGWRAQTLVLCEDLTIPYTTSILRTRLELPSSTGGGF